MEEFRARAEMLAYQPVFLADHALERMQQEGQQVEGGKERSKMLFAVAEIVLKMIALGLHHIVGTVLDLPSRPSRFGDACDVVRVERMAGDPGVVVGLLAGGIPGGELEPVDLEGVVAITQGHIGDEAVGVGVHRSAFAPRDLMGGDRVDALEVVDPFVDRAVGTGLADEDEVSPRGQDLLAEGLTRVEVVAQEGRAPRRVAVAVGGKPALRGHRFAVLLCVAILGRDEFRGQADDFVGCGRHHDRTDHRVGIAHRAIPVLGLRALMAMDVGGLVVLRPVQGNEQHVGLRGGRIELHAKRIDMAAGIEGTEDLLEQGIDMLGVDRIQQLADAGIGRDQRHLEEALGIAPPLGLLHRSLMGEKRWALGIEYRKRRQCGVFHRVDAILPLALIRQPLEYLLDGADRGAKAQGFGREKWKSQARTRMSFYDPATLYNKARLLSSPRSPLIIGRDSY